MLNIGMAQSSTASMNIDNNVTVKEALLPEEHVKVKIFLKKHHLDYDKDIEETFYIENSEDIIATISRSNHIIKGLAVDHEHRGKNLATMLVSKIVNAMRRDKIYAYMVYTKTMYVYVFESLNFRMIANTENVCLMEGGLGSIEQDIETMKTSLEQNHHVNLEKKDVGAIVVNCNPMTKGHHRLITESAKRHDVFIVFVVQEDESFFTFKERFSIVHLALSDDDSIIVVPSGKYIVSNLTFPSYFLKSINERQKEHAKLDGIIFRDYFLTAFNIRKRYVGTETIDVMCAYNDILKTYLGERLVEIKRFEQAGETISASLVRKHIANGENDKALSYVPKSTRMMLRGIINEK